jgi:type VI protein secretion system component Hcp
MPMRKKSINKSQKNIKKAAGGKAGATRLSGKSVTATKQMNLTIAHPIDKSSPKLFLSCATGQH